MKFKELKEKQQKNNFIRLKDGEEVVGVFVGDPVDYYQHYLPNEKKSYLCTGKGCELCKDNKASFRFRVRFAVSDVNNNTFEGAIYEGAFGAYKDLASLAEDYDLNKNLIKIKRKGTNKDTRYSFIPKPNGTLPDKEIEDAAKVCGDTIHLPWKFEDKGTESNPRVIDEPPPFTDDDIPF